MKKLSVSRLNRIKKHLNEELQVITKIHDEGVRIRTNLYENIEKVDHSIKLNTCLNQLFTLQRVDIDCRDNGEFIEQDERIEEDGYYIRCADLDIILSELKQII